MRTDILTLCDFAKEYNGKLVVAGIFDKISIARFPAHHQDFALVARIRCDKDEDFGKKQDVVLSIKKKDEDVYIVPSRAIQMDLGDAKGKIDVLQISVKINNVTIPSPGIYTISLRLDGNVFDTELCVALQKGVKPIDVVRDSACSPE